MSSVPRFKCEELTRHEIIRISIISKIGADPPENLDSDLTSQETRIQILLYAGKTRSLHVKLNYFFENLKTFQILIF